MWVYDDNITALRDGRWKLLLGNADQSFATPQLYDVEADPAESPDLAATHPDIVHRLSEHAATYADRFPTSGP